MPTNDFIPFCPTDTGTNLLTQSAYAAASDRTNGNQPGVASSKLNNKAIRQATYVVGQAAQYISDVTATDVLDDGVTAKLLAQINATFVRLSPKLTRYTSGSGTHNVAYWFFIATGNATAAATYTNNAVTFTVVGTVAGAKLVQMTGSGAPAVSGTLTKASGTGDATLTFYAVRAPISMQVIMAGAGGGGAGSGTGTSAGNGGTGGDTTFGAYTAGGGVGGSKPNTGTSGAGGTGGANTTGTGTKIAVAGTNGGRNTVGAGANFPGSSGGCNPLAGNAQLDGTGSGIAGIANTGAGGSGGNGNFTNTVGAGGGGGGGAYQELLLAPPLSTYAYGVGAAGTIGSTGTTGSPGSTGAAGVIVAVENYQ